LSDIASTPSTRVENRTRALGLRLFGISCLAVMTVLVKLASDAGVHLGEIMFWRQALAVPPVLAMILAGPGLASLATKRFGAHVTRSTLGLTSMAFYMGSITLLPLAEATTLGFTTPIFATILAAIILREQVGKHRIGAVIAGFIGVLIIVQPGGTHIPASGAAVGLTAALMVAITSLQIRDMGRTEGATTTVFWFSALSTLPMGLLLPFVITPHDAYEWGLLIGIGTLGGIGQIGLTAALRLAPVSTVIGMDYISLLWSSLFGWLIWNYVPGPATWIGAAIIIISGLYIAWREHQRSITRETEIVA
jgi:drug/metabolite transporter (DMT)-like permease